MKITIFILLAHFMGDWIFQPREIAKNKNSDSGAMFAHFLGVYLSLAAYLIFLSPTPSGALWAFGNAIIHVLQDSIIWHKDLWKIIVGFKKLDTVNPYENKLFWDVVAIDQFLHLAILFATYYWILV